MGDAFTYGAFRLLMPRRGLVREYDHRDVTAIAAIGTVNPGNSAEPGYDSEQGEAYDRLRRDAFRDFGLSVEGSVARPRLFSLADLKALPRRTQITKHELRGGLVGHRRVDRGPAGHRRAAGHPASGPAPATSPSMPTTPSPTASTCSTRCTRRPFWRMA